MTRRGGTPRAGSSAIGRVGVITGHPDTLGRVRVGTDGRGLQYGDPS
ncbi:hypothetical protein [Streptomyces sp. SID12501]|uniref:Uncharacterized protein n=1 Tax=Streptomyces sp. SID12501 TaxID=2706042 RepID=A0A6B3BGN7_9ACTN|nr:hypothetical protein [Streptomyces sp. SID12501]NEC84861.1 hypothetical protein [Streptomyces sp. SID12501]